MKRRAAVLLLLLPPPSAAAAAAAAAASATASAAFASSFSPAFAPHRPGRLCSSSSSSSFSFSISSSSASLSMSGVGTGGETGTGTGIGTGTTGTSSRHTLYDLPVSPAGARCRLVLYKKRIPETEVEIVSPQTIGGLKSPEYLALNPQGKMPLLVMRDEEGEEEEEDSPILLRGALPESDTICRYLCERYAGGGGEGGWGPSFLTGDATSNLVSRLVDTYVFPIQGCLYKAHPPFGPYGTRSDAIEEVRRQMRVIDDVVKRSRERETKKKTKRNVEGDGVGDGGGGGGPYLLGEEVSLGDAALFATCVFVKAFLPKFGVPEDEALPDAIGEWFEGLRDGDADFARVYDEMMGAIGQWESNGRWDSIHLAGLRDNDPPTIFDKIISGDIPASIVHSDDDVLAFRDINPAAPAHVLVIPKNRAGLSGLRKSSPEHVEILGKLLLVAGIVARDTELGFGDGGARVVINDGKDAGQEVPHLHLHVLGGREMTWPPG